VVSLVVVAQVLLVLKHLVTYPAVLTSPGEGFSW
jgi:hypothetical protein